MSKEMQIETEERWDLARIMAQNFHINGEGWDESDFEWTAHCVQMEGYRKQSEGEWKQKEFWEGGGTWRCTKCGRQIMFLHGTPKTENMHYCPNCGAKMRGRY